MVVAGPGAGTTAGSAGVGGGDGDGGIGADGWGGDKSWLWRDDVAVGGLLELAVFALQGVDGMSVWRVWRGDVGSREVARVYKSLVKAGGVDKGPAGFKRGRIIAIPSALHPTRHLLSLWLPCRLSAERLADRGVSWATAERRGATGISGRDGGKDPEAPELRGTDEGLEHLRSGLAAR